MPLVLLIVHILSGFKLSYMYVVTMIGTLFVSMWQAYFHSISFHFKLLLAKSCFSSLGSLFVSYCSH